MNKSFRAFINFVCSVYFVYLVLYIFSGSALKGLEHLPVIVNNMYSPI